MRSVVLPGLVLLLLACGAKGDRFRARQPITLTAGAGEVLTGGRLELKATRMGRPDPTLRWEVLDAKGGMVLPGGVYLAPLKPGTYRVRVQDPASGQKAETAIQVLVDAGSSGDPASVEIYDPGLFQGGFLGRMRHGRIGHAACLLKDGRVLVTGGYPRPGAPALASAEIFDPPTQTWFPCLALGEPRSGHSLTLLEDGTVLVLGGGSLLAERYDPVSDRFLSVGVCGAASRGHRVLALGNGDVLVAGSGIERFSQGRFHAVIPETEYALEGMSLVELSDRTVVLAGGATPAGPTADVMQLDVVRGQLEKKGALSRGRVWHEAFRMPGQKVVLYGGSPASGPASDAVEELDLETWTLRVGAPLDGSLAGMACAKLEDGRLVALGAREGEARKHGMLLLPVGNVLRPVRELLMGRVGHTLTLLKDGRILVVGGMERSDGPFRSRAGARS